MKFILLITLALPIAIFAQGPNTNVNPPAQVQTKNINYYDQSLNNDNNIVQTNVVNQQSGGTGTSFGSNGAPCADCDKLKKAIKLSHSGKHKRSFGLKKWSRTTEGKLNMKLRKTFARKHKVRSNYALCFNWH